MFILFSDTKSVRNLDLDEGAGKPWIVIVMDNVLVELMEGCGRTVSKLLSMLLHTLAMLFLLS